MAKINVLDFEIANLIAAGEVVERPSSVLKELIENSIDSGANKIVAEIKRGGVALIRVTDNGCGMDKEDLPVALKRHATSKISAKEDLDGITTLGFRGEALAAISSVSKVTIITKTSDAECGSMLSSEGGRVLDISEVGTSDGTTVVVEDLFFNVPARRKFLKKDSTEAMNVSALVEKVALSRPDISIQLLVDGEEKFLTPGDGEPINAIYAVYGKEFSSKLIKVDGVSDGIRVSGYIGRSDNVRKNRNQQNIFINNRYVKSLTVMAALEKAYTSYIAPECFPVAVLFLDINPKTVDVNVHPAKLEVKFANEQPIFEAVYYTVKNALEEHTYRPEMQLGGGRRPEAKATSAFVPIGENTRGVQTTLSSPVREPVKAPAEPIYRAPSNSGSSIDLDRHLRVSSGSCSGFDRHKESSDAGRMSPMSSAELLSRYATAKRDDYSPESKKNTPISQNSSSEITSLEKEPEAAVPVTVCETSLVKDYQIVGEAFDCYVMVEREGELLIIDKHAAHERVIFEELKESRADDGRVASQALLLPITAILTPDEISAVSEYREELLSVGFDFNINNTSADITAIPDAISAFDAEALFIKMADEIVEGRGNPSLTEKERREKALYQIACKAAIKGGRSYDASVISWLVDKVMSMPDIVVCPHGRPIAYKLTKSELDRQFDRIK